jgi:hypothetical protein
MGETIIHVKRRGLLWGRVAHCPGRIDFAILMQILILRPRGLFGCDV